VLVWQRKAPFAFPLLLFVVVSATLFYDPHVTPSPLWALRRFVPVTIPFLALLASVALLWRRAAVARGRARHGALVLTARPTIAVRAAALPDQRPHLERLAASPPARRRRLLRSRPRRLFDSRAALARARAGRLRPAAVDWRGALRTGTAALGPPSRLLRGGRPGAAPSPGSRSRRSARSRLPVTPKIEPDALPTAVEQWPLALRIHRVTAAP
jgi:hypothetical protein